MANIWVGWWSFTVSATRFETLTAEVDVWESKWEVYSFYVFEYCRWGGSGGGGWGVEWEWEGNGRKKKEKVLSKKKGDCMLKNEDTEWLIKSVRKGR